MIEDPLALARDLIKAKRYDEARAVLKGVNHPTAVKWMAKLDEVAPEDDPFAGAVPNRSAKATSSTAKLAGEVSALESKLRLLEDKIKDRAGQRNSATIVFIFSLILAPVGIGLVLMIFSLPNYFRHKRAVKLLQEEKAQLLASLDDKRVRLEVARGA